MRKVAAFVVQHFRDTIEPMGFKAFLVAVDREACALYKQALNKHLPDEYSTVVYSPAHNDEKLLKAYYLDADQEKQARREFGKKHRTPKIWHDKAKERAIVHFTDKTQCEERAQRLQKYSH